MKNKSKNEDSKKINRQLISILVFFLMLVVISLSLMLVRCDNSTPISLIKPFYTITYVDGNGTVLETDKTLEGEIPQYDGPLPEKVNDYNYAYDFDPNIGWTNVDTDEKGLKPATINVTYQAVFLKSPQDIRYIYDEATENYTVWRVINDSRLDHSPIIQQKYNDEFDPVLVRHGILPVTSIDKFAFRMNGLGQQVVSVTIPDSINTIREGAFVECTKLEEVNISVNTSKLTTIETNAFYGTSALKNFAFPVGLEVIGKYAFTHSAITSVNLTENSKLRTTVYAFQAASSLTGATLPNAFKVLSSGMFLFCTALKSITFSDSITVIEDSFFYETAITNLYIPASAASIGSYIVSYCKNLKQIRCGAPKKPSSWAYNWNWQCSAEIVWGQER